MLSQTSDGKKQSSRRINERWRNGSGKRATEINDTRRERGDTKEGKCWPDAEAQQKHSRSTAETSCCGVRQQVNSSYWSRQARSAHQQLSGAEDLKRERKEKAARLD